MPKANGEWWVVYRLTNKEVLACAERVRDALTEARANLGITDGLLAGAVVQKVKDARKDGVAI